MGKVKVIRYGVTHYAATCLMCDWVDAQAFGTEKAHQFLERVREHVEKTGHRVSVEKCSVVDYERGVD